VRLLALADAAPPGDVAALAAENAVDAVVCLGDLQPAWLAPLAGLALPRFGVHGNHDAPGALAAAGVEDVDLRRVTAGGWTFSGFAGCVRYGRGGSHQHTQAEAAERARRLPAADVLLCHCPPAGIDDEPDDPAHVGFAALGPWVAEHRPRYLLHGHTTPDPRTRTARVGATQVVWVRGARVLELRRG
jgi:Icc-related predicted phosphoesterase